MIKPAPSLFAKILGWFFLNLALVAVALTLFFVFQTHVNLHAIFGQESLNRLRTAAMLITHDLDQTPREDWSGVLARYARIHQVDFVLVLEDGARFFSKDMNFPNEVNLRVMQMVRQKDFPDPFPPRQPFGISEKFAQKSGEGTHGQRLLPQVDTEFPVHHFMTRTHDPARYWTGVMFPLPSSLSWPPPQAMLLAVSDSASGNGFFFDPFPWLFVAASVLLISVLFWIPMVRSITRSLARMTRATEEIARGRFDVVIHEPRGDEIGRLARGINTMTGRLSAFVTGQKRFLGDVAHELGSPIARIQFGLGVLEQRVEGDTRMRVEGVMEDVAHLSKLVGELLAFSRADLSNQTVGLEKMDLLPVVQEAIQREMIPGVEIIVDIDPKLQAVTSPDLLIRGLANLIRNAIRYAGDAGPIHISAEKKQDTVNITVRDTGPGVPEKFLDQLFEPFFRPEPSRDRDSGGVGLGLAIVKTCIETCRGTVAAHNRHPRGFAVVISLPA